MRQQELAEKAMGALRQGDPVKAREALEEAVQADPERMDLLHALAVTLVQLGEPHLAKGHIDTGLRLAEERRDETAAALMPQLLLARAAACEDTYDPAGSEAAYRAVLQREPQNPRARAGLGYLLLAWGRLGEGLAELQGYLDDAVDGPEFLRATGDYVAALKRFSAEDLHPRNLLDAHRGGYVEFFDHHAKRMEAQGWIAEAARMMRDAEGQVVPAIPEGARRYAAVRIDLVDPATGQPGQVGDQPMVVALAGYEPLAQSIALLDWPELPFPVWVSTQAPWDQLPVQVRIGYNDDVIQAIDPSIGDWYTAGFNGAFGSHDRGRFHYISDPERVGPRSVLYHVDCGRAEVRCIDDLLRRLEILHTPYKIDAVVIGRGFLPEVAEPLPPQVMGAR